MMGYDDADADGDGGDDAAADDDADRRCFVGDCC